MIQYEEGMNDAQEAAAHEIIETLNVAYPNHPWYVRVYDNGFFIRHMDFPKTWGINYRSGKELYSASSMKRKIIMMGGEFLERANLKRGMGDGEQEIRRLEGVPEKEQPYQPLPEGMKVVVAPSTEPERTEPRPQVKKALH